MRRSPWFAPWRLVAVLCALPLLLAAAGAVAQTGDSGELRQLRALALELVNQERRRHDLAPFAPARELEQAAQSHARDMLQRGYYAHESPEGKTVMDRYRAAGGPRWRLVAENIARCAKCAPPPRRDDVERLHRGWMQSPEHRDNILNPGLDRFGFGIIAAPKRGLYAVQTFAGPGAAAAAGEPGDPAHALSPAEQTGGAVELINQVRRADGLPSVRSSDPLAEAARVLLERNTGEGLDLGSGGSLAAALAPGERANWRSLSLIAAACGGCGSEPVAADLRFFRDQWLQDPQHRQVLLQPSVTDMGFAIVADGEGRKLAAAVLGQRR